MKIKDAEWKECKECGSRDRVSDEEYGCDSCRKPINQISPNKKHHDYLGATVFYEGEDKTEHLQFCSWECALRGLSKVKTDYFTSLSHLHYDEDVVAGQSARDFFRAIRKFGKKGAK